jgi:RNA polymerase sigma factor (sigma-70 family)
MNATHAAIEAVWKAEAARIVATVARIVRDIGAAEELAQDALVIALEQWPRSGIPDNAGAWLTTAAKRRAIDLLRRGQLAERKVDELGHEMAARGEAVTPDFTVALAEQDDSAIGDDLLRLVFTACHPLLSAEAQVALTLRLIGGLSTAEIARAFLVPEPTVAQRIVRAKRTLAEARVPFEVPPAAELPARLSAVLAVLYLVFNEGYAATAGGDWTRPALCEEALRQGRLLAQLLPREPEVHGLVALMELQASRLAARVDGEGMPVLLQDQDRQQWDRMLIRRGLGALERAEHLLRSMEPQGFAGPYTVQAAIAACHARAPGAAETDWERVVTLYDALFDRLPSPVVALNRAVAVSMAEGPGAALPMVEDLLDTPALKGYHLLPAVQGDLLWRLGRHEEARQAFGRAATLAQNARERGLMLQRAAARP